MKHYFGDVTFEISKDLSVGVISVFTDIVWKITVAWHAGNIACKVIRFSQVSYVTASLMIPSANERIV